MDGPDDTRIATFAVLCARLRLPVLVAGVALIGADLAFPAVGLGPFGMALLLIGLALYVRLGTPGQRPSPPGHRSRAAGRC